MGCPAAESEVQDKRFRHAARLHQVFYFEEKKVESVLSMRD